MNYGLPSEAVSPFRLRALTIRGLASYLHGTRLEIKPLTILCGTNGSGKSTWIRMLNILRKSLDDKNLPFDLSEDVDSVNYQYTNAHLADPESPEDMPQSIGSDWDFGRPGTFGIEIESLRDFQLTRFSSERIVPKIAETALSSFILEGSCVNKTNFKLFFTSPKQRHRSYGFGYPLSTGFDIEIDNTRINFHVAPGKNECEVFCSKSLIEQSGTGTEMVSFCQAMVSQNRLQPYQPNKNSDRIEFCNQCIQRVLEITRLFLDGYFHIGAVRVTNTGSSEAEIEPLKRDEIVKKRYVGTEGKDTLLIRNEYFLNTMLNIPLPYAGYIDNKFHGYETARQLLRTIETCNPELSLHLLSLVSTENKQNWFEFLKYNKDALLGDIQHNIENREFWRHLDKNLALKEQVDQHSNEFEQYESREDVDRFRTLFEQYTCAVFNEMLESRNLYSPLYWKELNKEAQFLVDKGIAYLCLGDLIRLNRILLDVLIRPEQDYANYGFVLDVFNSKWLAYLLETHSTLDYSGNDSAGWWVNSKKLPTGFLLSYEPGQRAGDNNYFERKDYHRFVSKPFKGIGLPAAPSNLSSGFHQIEPIIIQLGIMKQSELCSIENPEVHLHPDLQLKISEFLINQAHIGKFVLIETHSDLVVQRAIRAILQEEISQNEISIYFTRLETQANIAYSHADLINVNQHGQIVNWPDGFMDIQVAEARRLLDLMYGSFSNEVKDDD